jgi:hypothetical protein
LQLSPDERSLAFIIVNEKARTCPEGADLECDGYSGTARGVVVKLGQYAESFSINPKLDSNSASILSQELDDQHSVCFNSINIAEVCLKTTKPPILRSTANQALNLQAKAIQTPDFRIPLDGPATVPQYDGYTSQWTHCRTPAPFPVGSTCLSADIYALDLQTKAINDSGFNKNAGSGANIVAAADGIVRTARNSPASCYGTQVIIDHKVDGIWYHTLYGHFITDSFTVVANESVKRGQVIGKLGDTGIGSGPHLHYALRTGKFNGTLCYRNEVSVNPLPLEGYGPIRAISQLNFGM